jgi:hypothetical protein
MHQRPILILVCCLLFSSEVSAEQRDPVVAEQLFKQGRVALERRDYVNACKRFQESDRLDPAVGTLMNWATCEQRLGKIATAWQLWREAVDRLDRRDDRAPFARKQLQALEPRLPQLTLKPGFPPSTPVVVLRDGVRLTESALNVPLPIDPGSHVILVRKSGHADQRYRVDIAERERRTLTIQVGLRAPQVASTEPEQDTTALTWGYVLTGIGMASIGGAVVTHVMLEEKEDVVAANCPNKVCNHQGFAAVQDSRSLTILSRALWVAGGTALGGGVVLLLVGTGSPDREEGVGLAVSPGSLGIVQRGSF